MKEEVKIVHEDHLFTSDHKLKFCGYGEWVEEPDVVVIRYRDYEAMVYRILRREPYSSEEHWFGGHLCGYVKIPNDHPYFMMQYEDMDIRCHWGLTFGQWGQLTLTSEFDKIFPGGDEVHIIGFDCAHSGDINPSMELFNKTDSRMLEIKKLFAFDGMEDLSFFNPIYRNIQFCIDECVSIIDQLIDIKNGVTASSEGTESNEEKP